MMFRVFSAVLIGVLAACGGGGGTGEELSRQQQFRFATALQNVGKIATSVKTTGQNLGGVVPTSATGGERDQDVAELVGSVEKAMKTGQCRIPTSLPLDFAFPSPDLTMARPPKLEDVSFSIEGTRCPVEVTYVASAKGELLKGGTVDYKLVFNAKSDAVRDMMDVDSFTASGTAVYSLKEGSGTPETEFQGATIFPFSMEAKWNVDAALKSVTEGDISAKLAMAINVDAKSMLENSGVAEFSLSLQFKDFLGILKAKHFTGGKGTGEYFFNQTPLTLEQFMNVLIPVRG